MTMSTFPGLSVPLTPPAGMKSPKAASPVEDRQAGVDRLLKLKKVCADFEAIFIGQMVKAMRQGGDMDGFLPEAAGSDVYDSMFDQHFSSYLAQGQGLGLGQAVFNQVVHQEGLEDLARELADQKKINYQPIVPGDRMPGRGLVGAEAAGGRAADRSEREAAPAEEEIDKDTKRSPQ